MMRDLLLPSILTASLCLLGSCDKDKPADTNNTGNTNSSSSSGGGDPASGGGGDSSSQNAGQDGGPGWSYAGDTGPEHWGSLRPEWAMARRGKKQSPVAIYPSETKLVDVEPLKLEFGPSTVAPIRGTYFASMARIAGSQLDYGRLKIDFRGLEYRVPSEHTIADKRFDAELQLHFVGLKRVISIAVLLEVGETADAGVETLLDVWEKAPTSNDGSHQVEVDLSSLNWTKTASYRYQGSRTTPPCAEGVNWCVLKNPVTISAEQLKRLQALGKDCARPVQPLHGRYVSEAL